MSKEQKILVVDDEPINIDVLTGVLKSQYALLVAKSGEHAIRVANSGKPDLILLDIMMPEMDGYEVCRRLKTDEATRDIPVIFITAMKEIEDEAKGLQIGAVDYITKPISPAILMARVQAQLSLVKHEKELQAAYAIIKLQKDRMEEELNVGRDIQMGMMPVNFPHASDDNQFALHARLEAARELGGDFYDFFFLDESAICLCVGDVSGKGVPAALFMAITKTLIRSSAESSRSTADIISETSNTLAKGNANCMFVTLFMAICDIRSGEITYTNAGHNPPYVIKANGELLCLNKRHGLVGGVMEGVHYGEDTMTLQADDTLFLFTDGVTEAQNSDEELFAEDRLMACLQQHASEEVESLNNAVMLQLHDFENGAEQADDITMLSFRYKGQGIKVVNAHKSWLNLTSTAEVNVWLDAFAEEHQLEPKVQQKINMVIDDMVMNIISYAFNGNEDKRIEVKLDLDESRLAVTLTDNGKPFNPFEQEVADVSLSIEDREIGGLGIHLCREMMDDTSYQRSDEQNIVTLSINLSS
jgi:sigma-B regulation protein RsbU (phosphoserine phosphatase)